MDGKIGPEDRAKIELGVVRLVEEEITDAISLSRADEEVGVSDEPGIEIEFELLLIEIVREASIQKHIPGKGAAGSDDLIPTPITQSDLNEIFFVFSGFLYGVLENILYLCAETGNISNDLDTGLILYNFKYLFGKKLLNEIEEDIFFRFWSFPVLTGKGVDRDNLDADISAIIEDSFDDLDPAPMTDSRAQTMFMRPSSIAVGNNSYMSRQFLWIQIRQYFYPKETELEYLQFLFFL